MTLNWSTAFDHFGVKTVTTTDKNKAAFVLNSEQKAALSAAGFEPGHGGPNATFLSLHVLSEESRPLDVSYYDSVREGAGRTPETRMGRDLIHWVEVGDTVGIGNIGEKVFVWKSAEADAVGDVARRIAKGATLKDLLKKARKAAGKPAKQMKQVSDFKRNLAVVAGALARANGACEMPNCTSQLFEREDGRNFLEVHHVIPLAEDGEDTMKNAAALCPMCHRELHFGKARMSKRAVLQAAISAKEP